MKPITSEWVEKAEGDFNTAQRELLVEKDPNYDAVCFHSQQSAEKYLKARLQEAGIPVPQIHDLSVLLDLVLPVEPDWETLRAGLHSLTAFAVEYRYPGEIADESEAREAFDVIAALRRVARRALEQDL